MKRLALAGYIEREEYEERNFVVRGIRYYAVLDDFPRVKRSDLASAIVDIRYVLDVSRCLEFERKSCFE